MADWKPLTGRDNDYLKIVVPAASRGDVAALESYLEAESSYLTRIGPHGRTLLWEAARKGKVDALRWLAELGAPIDVPGCYHWETTIELRPLGIARVKKRKGAMEALRELGATDDIYTACYLGESDTVLARIDEDPELLDRPLERRAGPFGGKADPLLAYAVAGGHVELTRALIERGAKVDFEGERLVKWAGWSEKPALVELVLASGARVKPGCLVEDRRT